MKYILLLFIGLIWGSQYVFNAIALHDFSAFGLTAWRMFIGFVTLSLLITLIPAQRSQSLVLTKKLIGLFIVIGAAEAAIPFWLIGFGQMSVSSSVAAIIMGMIPMLTVLLEVGFKKGHKTSVYEIIGMTLAFVGLIVLVNPSADDFAGSALGYVAIFMAAACFALALILMEKIPREISSVHATCFILAVYALPMLLIWFLNSPVMPRGKESILSVLIIGIFSSGIVYILYLNLIRVSGPTFTSLSNYIVPLVGTFMGVWFLSEPFTSNIAFALLFIVLGLFIANIKKQQ
ncbi:MAG TPA: DMT family transporter [Sulfurovum sp.]|nr:DMT family transporter [Sulfurovum sp.]